MFSMIISREYQILDTQTYTFINASKFKYNYKSVHSLTQPPIKENKKNLRLNFKNNKYIPELQDRCNPTIIQLNSPKN